MLVQGSAFGVQGSSSGIASPQVMTLKAKLKLELLRLNSRL